MGDAVMMLRVRKDETVHKHQVRVSICRYLYPKRSSISGYELVLLDMK